MMGYNHSDFTGDEENDDDEEESKYKWNNIYVTNTAL
jgi:hypothetical protein